MTAAEVWAGVVFGAVVFLVVSRVLDRSWDRRQSTNEESTHG